MPATGYLITVLVVLFLIDFSLRAVPFLLLKPLRESSFVNQLALWMPAGILGVLAIATFWDAVDWQGQGRLFPALVALVVTVAAHLWGGRRTLLSVGLGTLTFVLLVSF